MNEEIIQLIFFNIKKTETTLNLILKRRRTEVKLSTFLRLPRHLGSTHPKEMRNGVP